jgi:glycosyltransferase involved in cell wall biosynthesis
MTPSEQARRPRATFVVPFLSEFRQPFFRLLRQDLDAAGIDLTIAHGRPHLAEISARADTVPVEGAVELAQRSISLGGRALVHKRLGPLLQASDVLVVDQALRNVELYPQLVRQRTGRGPAIAMWDHGRTYHKPQTRLEQAVKFALTRRASWFFAYTEGGARTVVENGFPPARTTVVQNTVDTRSLLAAYERATDEQLARVRAEYGLTPGRTALYIGALSPHKHIPLVLEAAQAAARLLPGFRLLVAGQGELQGLVDAAAARCPAVVPVGQAFGERKALLGAVSEVLFMPGLVGLCVADSFALRAPVVWTPRRYHPPEFEYLRDGVNSVRAPGDPEGYARAVTDLLQDAPRLAALQHACREEASRYTMEEMSRRFTQGLVGLVRSLPPRRRQGRF